jgi:lipoprotein-releasing system ATP-binding protein
MSDPLLAARDLHKVYRSGDRRIAVLQGLDLDVAEREAVAIVGASGVGKSTLLHILGGLDRPDRGVLSFQGTTPLCASEVERAAYRNRQVGFVFQFHHLLPEFSALENVEMPFRVGRRPVDRVAARRLLERLGLGERLSHRPAQLSGGEQQRVAIARALIGGPALVLADEPTGNLDPATGAAVFRLLRELQAERPFALVLATHNAHLARGCDRVLQLDAGVLHALGPRETGEYFDELGTLAGPEPML